MAKSYSLGAVMGGDVVANPVGISAKSRREPVKSHLKRIEIEIADNGGFSVTCYHTADNPKTDGGYIEPTKSVFEDKGSLDDYLDDQLGTAE